MKTCSGLISFFLIFVFFLRGHQAIVSEMAPRKVQQSAPGFQQQEAYSWLAFEQSFVLPASAGVKSILFNAAGTKLYALNLEGMSIYEYGRENRKLLKVIDFKPTAAPGWDYLLNKPIASSFAEKPVEACLSHQDQILWVSLHNAGGIVPILLDSIVNQKWRDSVAGSKVIYIRDLIKHTTDTLFTPLIRTGVMPKVIAKTADDKTLLVSNWGSKTLSVLQLNDTIFPYARNLATVKLPGIPRGIALDQRHRKAYIGIFSDSKIAAIKDDHWKIDTTYRVLFNPRHLVLDSSGRLFVSFNLISQIGCFDIAAGKLLFKTNTHLQPRTIALSKNNKFLFVACYEGNTLDVYKINKNSFSRIYAIKSEGKPVGVSLYEDDNYLEAWVCNYMAADLKIFRFKKK